MKRIWALCLVLCMVISMLAGCSSGTGKESGDDAGNNNDNSKTVSSTNADGTKESDDASGNSNQAAPVTLDERTGIPLAVGYPKEGGEISVWTVWSSNFLESMDEVAAVGELEKQTGIKVDWTSVDRGERNEKFGILIS